MMVNFFKRRVYGNDTYYIVDGDIANCVRTLTGRKTITLKDLECLKELGIESNEVLDDGS
jgi:hypothetical protein